MQQRANHSLPVAVIGAGPVGLSAAAQLLARGFTPLVLEAGAHAGSSIRAWSHVRFFSPWKYLVDPMARRLLEEHGWTMPPGEELPTGGEFVGSYLEPLAALRSIRPHVRYGHRVRAISRLGFDKVRSAGRAEAPFEIVCETEDGRQRFLAQAVIDASGTYTTANPIGASGAAELMGALGLVLPSLTRIRPSLTPLAAAGLAGVMLLAASYNLFHGRWPAMALNLVLGSMAVFVAWGRFRRLPLPPRRGRTE